MSIIVYGLKERNIPCPMNIFAFRCDVSHWSKRRLFLFLVGLKKRGFTSFARKGSTNSWEVSDTILDRTKYIFHEKWSVSGEWEMTWSDNLSAYKDAAKEGRTIVVDADVLYDRIACP